MGKWRKFIPITKVDAKQRLVYGVAALEEPDKSGEIFDYASSKPYVEAWSAEMSKATDGRNKGNVRAMHGKVAAGRLVDITFDDDNKMIPVCAKITDDAEWQKVEDAVYTGFSIGGDYVKRWNDGQHARYTASIAEVSIVDNPAMPGAHFTMVKADGAEESRTFAKYVQVENNMAVTNDHVVARAQLLAKQKGATSFADFIGEARNQLMRGVLPSEMSNQPVTESGVMRPSGKATITPASGVQNDEELTDGHPMPSEMTNKPEQNEPGNTATADEHRGGANMGTQPPDVIKTNVDPRNQVRQGWQAKDGSFHVSKAAALAHNDTLNDPGAALEAAIAKAAEAVALAKKGGDMNDSPVINQEMKDKAKGKKSEKEDMGGAEMAAGGEAVAEPNVMDDPNTSTHPMKANMPYGDVEYADPGYKADKKKRYPVDTEKHIRAAWSYIHKPHNHMGYTAQQVSSIKSKIVAAWKKVIGGEPPEAATKAFRANELQKGLYSVSRLASLVEDLVWLQNSLEMEAEHEKDGSPVPAQLKGDIASLVGTLKNMLDEETSELFTPDELVDFADCLEMAAGGVGPQLKKFVNYLGNKPLNKSDNHVSLLHSLLKAFKMPQEHMERLQQMHDHCCEMGAKCDMGGMGKAAGDGELSKAAYDQLQKNNARLTDLLEKATTQIGALAADISLIKSQPVVVPPGRLNVVGKGEEPQGLEAFANPSVDLLKHFTPDQLATAAIRLSHGTGGMRLTTRRE